MPSTPPPPPTGPPSGAPHGPPGAPPGPPGAPPGPVGAPRPAPVAVRVIEVEVVAVSATEVEVKLADGRPGVIGSSDVGEPRPAVGDTVRAALLARDDPRRRVVLSRAWAQRLDAWDRIEAARDAREPLTGPVVRSVKGGLVVDLGVRAFLPISLVGEGEGFDAATLVGSDVTVLVTDADRGADRLVVSRRDVLRRERRVAERDLFDTLTVGSTTTGTVVALLDYGVQVDLGGLRGLVHRTELAWGRVGRPSEVVSVGDEIEVVVLAVNRSKRRISLSRRQALPDPYADVEVGAIRLAEVTRVVEYGVFARLEGTDVVGLVHQSELSDLPGMRPDQLVTPGEQVHVKVLSVDRDRRRVGLSIRQALWS